MINFSKSPAISSPSALVSVFLRVFCLAGYLAALSCSAQTNASNSVTAPPASTPATLVAALEAVLTVQETDAWIVQDYSVYASAYTNLIENLDALLYELDPTVNYSIVGSVMANCDTLLASPAIASNATLYAAVMDIKNTVAGGLAGWGYSTVGYCKQCAEDIDAEIVQTRILESATMTLEGGELPSSGCSCPDYSSVLGRLETALNSLDYWLTDIDGALWDFVVGFHDETGEGGQDFLDLGRYLGVRLKYLGEVLSETAGVQVQYGAATGDGGYLATGTAFGVALLGLSEVFDPSGSRTDNAFPVSDAMRSWWLGSPYVFPTNDEARALWVRYAENPFLAAVTNPAFRLSVSLTNGPASPVFVAVSNALDVRVQNINDFSNLLASISVYVDNRQRQETEVNVRVEEGQGEMAELDEDVEAPDIDMQDGEVLQCFNAFRTMTESFGNLYRDHSGWPQFWFDYHFHFSQTVDPDVGSVDVLLPLGYANPEGRQSWFANAVRAACLLLWTLLLAFFYLWIARWVFRLAAYILATAFAVAQGDLSALARLIPGLAKQTTGEGGGGLD